MQIDIVTNTFGKYHRQNVAVDSWKHLKSLYPSIITLNNFQFSDEKETFQDHYEGVDTSFRLLRSSKDLMPDATKKLPMVSDIIFQGFKYDADYVLFTNSDVILMPNLIQYIIEHKPECMAVSRLDIEDIPSYDSIINKTITPVRYEIAGFDAFLFERKWFMNHKKYFISNFLLGKPYFDPSFAGLMAIFSDKFKMGNGFPPFAFHIHHGTASVDTDCPERTHNEKIFNKNPWFKIAYNLTFYNLQYNLCRRKPWGTFMQPIDGEQETQETFFDVINIKKDNKIRYIQ